MLTLVVQADEREMYDERSNTFIVKPAIPRTELHLEHSLISLSKWESKWKKPFLNLENPTPDEMIDYVCCMSIDKNIGHDLVNNLTQEDFMKIRNYIADSHTATTVSDRRGRRGGKREVYTSELLYYYMIFYGIPFSCEKWHLNRLLMLIRICGVKGGTTNQEMSLNEIFAQNNRLNKARRAGRSGR